MCRPQQFPELLAGLYLRDWSSAEKQRNIHSAGRVISQGSSEKVAASVSSIWGLKLFILCIAELPISDAISRRVDGVTDTPYCGCSDFSSQPSHTSSTCSLLITYHFEVGIVIPAIPPWPTSFLSFLSREIIMIISPSQIKHTRTSSRHISQHTTDADQC